MDDTRTEISTQIEQRLVDDEADLRSQFHASPGVKAFVVDELLDTALAHRIHDAFPASSEMTHKRSLREHKYVTAQMDRHDPLLEAVVYAFQAPGVVKALERVTGIPALEPDAALYAGGLSVMERDQFLNPHLDNSHDLHRERYRVLNSLYYVSPGWATDHGGHLELWPEGLRGAPRRIESRFNRLVVMATTTRSWHSVSRVTHDGRRCCVSNYFFASTPIDENAIPVDADHFHITTFRGFPRQRVRDLALRADGLVRTGVRRIYRFGISDTGHRYRKDEEA